MKRLNNEFGQQKSVDNLLTQIRSLLESEYKRGAADSLQSLARILGGEEQLSPTPDNSRVPRGSARVFVEKTLTSTPQSIAQIRSAAKSSVEKRLSYQTIRLELERGRKEKRYKKSNGRWSVSA